MYFVHVLFNVKIAVKAQTPLDSKMGLPEVSNATPKIKFMMETFGARNGGWYRRGGMVTRRIPSPRVNTRQQRENIRMFYGKISRSIDTVFPLADLVCYTFQQGTCGGSLLEH